MMINNTYPRGYVYRLDKSRKKKILFESQPSTGSISGKKIEIFKIRRRLTMGESLEKRQVSFRLSDDEWLLLKQIIYEKSMQAGELISKTEYIKGCLFNKHIEHHI